MKAPEQTLAMRTPRLASPRTKASVLSHRAAASTPSPPAMIKVVIAPEGFRPRASISTPDRLQLYGDGVGYAVASDIDKTLVGISAPIFLPSGDVTASLCLVKLRKEVSQAELEPLGEMAKRAAAEITSRLRKPLRSALSRAPKGPSMPTSTKGGAPRRPATSTAKTLARRAAGRRARA